MAMINLQDIPDDVYRQFKSQCALQGNTIKEVIIALMIDYLSKKPCVAKKEE